MARGFFSRFTRLGGGKTADTAVESPVEGAVPEIAEIAREIARQGLPAVPRKEAISLRLDADILEWFRAQGPGYQTRINAVLRAYKEAAG